MHTHNPTPPGRPLWFTMRAAFMFPWGVTLDLMVLVLPSAVLPSAGEWASKIHGPMYSVSIFAHHLGLLFVTRLAPRAPCCNSVNCASTGSSPGASQLQGQSAFKKVRKGRLLLPQATFHSSPVRAMKTKNSRHAATPPRQQRVWHRRG